MDKISLFHGQKFAISEFSRHINYDFLKEDHSGSSHTKSCDNLQRHLKDIGQKHSKMANLTKKIFDQNFF